MLNDYERSILEEIINEEILSYLESGYELEDEYTITLRHLLKKFSLKEIYNFDEKFKKEYDEEEPDNYDDYILREKGLI